MARKKAYIIHDGNIARYQAYIKNRQVHNISEILPQKLSYYEHTIWDYY